jgi:hypothetical protein
MQVECDEVGLCRKESSISSYETDCILHVDVLLSYLGIEKAFFNLLLIQSQ